VSCLIYCSAELHYAECRYAECRYAECHYAECRYAGCRGADEQQLKEKLKSTTLYKKILLKDKKL